MNPDAIKWLNPKDLSRSVIPVKSAAEDVNDDGYIDRFLFFLTEDLVADGVLDSRNTSAVFIGQGADNATFGGTDSLRIVPEGNGKKEK